MKLLRMTTIVLMVMAILLGTMNVAFGGASVIEGDTKNIGKVNSVAASVLGAGQVICYVAAVILIMWMGVKWLISAPEGKAEMKKGLIVAAVASALLMGAGAIMSAVGSGIASAVSS